MVTVYQYTSLKKKEAHSEGRSESEATPTTFLLYINKRYPPVCPVSHANLSSPVITDIVDITNG